MGSASKQGLPLARQELVEPWSAKHTIYIRIISYRNYMFHAKELLAEAIIQPVEVEVEQSDTSLPEKTN